MKDVPEMTDAMIIQHAHAMTTLPANKNGTAMTAGDRAIMQKAHGIIAAQNAAGNYDSPVSTWGIESALKRGKVDLPDAPGAETD